MKTQERTVENKKSGQEVAKTLANRFHVDYWRSRLFRKTYTHQGQRREVEEWSVRMQHLGHRETFALGTANSAAGATKAKEIATYLEANGWEQTRARYKPAKVTKVKSPTVGDFLKAARAVTKASPNTFNTYSQKFRSIVAGIEGLEPKIIERPKINDKTGKPQISRKTGKPIIRQIDSRYDYVYGGAQEWRQRIDAVPLDRVTPEKVQRWVSARLQAFADNPAKLASARTTLNSVIRAGESLFASKIVKHINGLQLPSPLPFQHVDKPAAPRRRYETRANIGDLHRKAEKDLRDAVGKDAAVHHEMFAIYLLALFAGLRRDEIDTLTWNQIDFINKRVHVETNEHTAAKSEHSEGSVGLDDEVIAYLKQKYDARTGEFVIESPVQPKPSASFHHYRCNRLFRKLNEWLKECPGLKVRTPLHTLRKEFGSIIARKFGIFAASEALRHGDIRLTRDYYLARDKTATFGPSSLNG